MNVARPARPARPVRRRSRAIVVVAAWLTGMGLLTGASMAGPAGPPSGSQGLVYDHDFPDPTVLPIADGYYAYSTQVGSRNVPVLFSADLSRWIEVADALPVLPAWAVPGRTWAPSVIERDGRYLLYYATHDKASDRQCISAAVAQTPTGPFTDTSTGPLVCQIDLGGSIDPDAFADGGALYLNFRSDEPVVGGRPRLWSARLADDGLGVAAGSTVELLAAGRPGEAGLIEGPAMVRAGRDYLLFYSGNWFSSVYESISYARCSGPQGPCVTQLTLPWFSAVPDFNQLGAEAGPGGPAVFQDAAGGYFLAYHAWSAPRTNYEVGGYRGLHIRPLRLSPTPTLPSDDEAPRQDQRNAA